MSTSTYPTPAPFREVPCGLGEFAGIGDTGKFEMVGTGPAIQRLRLQVRRIGPHFRTILISGEPGSGKELAARALHAASHGASGPFVICHSATLGDQAIEGAEAGYRIAELMKLAARGTLFFDGIDEMPLEAQGRLLRVLRRHEWSQQDGASGLGAPPKLDLRMAASSSQDLRVLVAAGRFRQELYHRMATLTIDIPPLRDRSEDIHELATHFLTRFAHLYDKPVTRIDPAAADRLRTHYWPGNVRELESVLRNAVLLTEGPILELQSLPTFDTAPLITPHPSGDRLQDVVEHHVLNVLKTCAGNKLRAAETLGISRSTLYRMLEGRGAPDAV